MKWFKHQSDLPRDEGVSRYLDKAGKDRLSAYGFLTLVLEAVASRMENIKGDVVCSATYSIRQWERITYSHANRVRKYLHLCEVIGWVQVEFEGRSCMVTIPRMVEWRDEYTRKSGHSPDRVAQSRVDKIRLEKRESIDEDPLSECLTAKDSGFSPPRDFKISESLQEWAANSYPSVNIQKETDKFRRYEFSTPRSNWDDQWKIWIQRAAEYEGTLGAETDLSDDTQDMLELGALMSVERRPDETTLEYCSRVREINQRRLDSLVS